jgi:hypothetical protein
MGKPRATWRAKRKRGWALKKGKLVEESGKIVALELSFRQG